MSIVTYKGIPLEIIEQVFRHLIPDAAVVKVRLIVDEQIVDVAWTQAEPITVGYLTLPMVDTNLSVEAFEAKYERLLPEMMQSRTLSLVKVA